MDEDTAGMGKTRNHIDKEDTDVEKPHANRLLVDNDDAVTAPKKDVDGGWAWTVLFASFMNLLLASGICFVSGIFQKLFLEEFGESVAFTAWVTSLFSSLMQLAGPLSGLVTSVTNCRIAVMLGGALIAFGLAASSFATSLNYLLVTFGLISGVGVGLMYTPSIVIINYYFDRRRTFMSGLSLSAAGFGITGSPILSRFLIDHTSWREALLILAAVSAHVCLFGALMFPLHEPRSSCVEKVCRAWPRGRSREPEKSSGVEAGSNDTKGDVKLTCNGEQVNPANGDCNDPWEGRRTSEQSDFAGHVNDVSGSVKCSNSSLSKIAVTAPTDGHESPQDDVRRVAMLNRTSVSESKKEGVSAYSVHRDDITSEGDKLCGERAQLLGQENEAAIRERNIPRLKDCKIKEPSKTTGHSSAISAPQNNHFSSRTSLNQISHHLDGTNVRFLQNAHDSKNNRQYSSAHNLHGKHLSHHHQSNGSLGRSLLNVDRRVSSKGSKLDVRVLSVYSSIPSLYSLGLPQVEEIAALAPSSTAAATAVGECGEDGGQNEIDGRGCCSNLMIFKNVPFLFLLANLFLSNAACGIFNIHLPAFSQKRGLDDHDITLVLAMDGLAVFFSRLLLGILGNDAAVDKLSVYFGLHLIASFVQVLLPFSEDIVGVTMFTVGMGIYYGGVYALLSSLTISIVGIPVLAFAFGVEMIAAGFGYLVAPPIAGWIVDVTVNYDNSMYLGGFLMFLSAISLLCLSCGRPPGAGPIGYRPAETDLEYKMEEEKA